MEAGDLQFLDFWQWFTNHQSEFNSLSNPDELFWDTALEQIQKVDKQLRFELSRPDSTAREFIVTTEGYVEAFPIAERLVLLAPTLNGWVFVALKPPMGFTFTTRYEDILFEPQSMWFLPLTNPAYPENFAIRVGIEGLKSIDETVAHNAVLVILDTALGERTAALDIQHIEVSELPANPESLGYIELPELAEYIAWRKGSSSLQSS